MRKTLVILVGLLVWFWVPVQAQTCPGLPVDGYNLPGVVLEVKDVTSGECFNVWLDTLLEVGTYLDESSMASPKLVVYVDPSPGVGYLNGHNSAYGWWADTAVFVDGATGDYVSPSDLHPNNDSYSVFDYTIESVVDNRPREWAEFGIANERVDVSDFLPLVNIFGSSLGDADFNHNYDLKTDGKIDLADLVLIAVTWGEDYLDFPIVDSYVPSACGTWDATLVNVTFENLSGSERTFWMEIERDGVWHEGPHISVPDQAGGDFALEGYGDVTNARLRIADGVLPTINNVQWSRVCDYAPPVGIKYDGQPDPFTGAAKTEAINAGTWFTAESWAEAPTILTQAGLDELGITEAMYESATGEELEIVPAYSPGQISQTGLAEFLLYYGNGNFRHMEYQVSGITVHEWKMHAYMYQIHLPFENHEIRVRGRVFEMNGAFTTDLWSADQFTFGTYVSISKGQFAVFNRRYCGLWTHFVDGRNVTLTAGGSNIECFFLP
jgi:hypothetical protein